MINYYTCPKGSKHINIVLHALDAETIVDFLNDILNNHAYDGATSTLTNCLNHAIADIQNNSDPNLSGLTPELRAEFEEELRPSIDFDNWYDQHINEDGNIERPSAPPPLFPEGCDQVPPLYVPFQDDTVDRNITLRGGFRPVDEE